jgi:hypothetical protein
VSRVFHKNTDVKKPQISGLLRINSIGHDDLLDYSSLPPLMDPSYTNDDFKGITNQQISSTKSQSDGYYLPSFSINNQQNQFIMKPEDNNYHRIINYDHHHHNQEINPTMNNYTSNSNSNQTNLNNPIGNTLSQPQIRIQNPNLNYFMYQNRMMQNSIPTTFGNNNECKMEQFSSNQSQDTGLSNDTSSAVSGRNRAMYEDLDGPSSVAPLSDLQSFWDY